MKKPTLLLIPFLAAIALMAQQPTGDITLQWSQSTGELYDGLHFQVWHSTDIDEPLTNWTVLTNLHWTTARGIGITNGMNVMQVDLTVTPGVNFFAMTASNFWGQSGFSDVASTPPLPSATSPLTIMRRSAPAP